MQENQENNELIENIAEETIENSSRSSSKIFLFVLALHIIVIAGAIGFHLLGAGQKTSKSAEISHETTVQEGAIKTSEITAQKSPSEKVPLDGPFFTSEKPSLPMELHTTPEAAARREAEMLSASEEQTTPAPELLATLPTSPAESEPAVVSNQDAEETIYIVRPGDTLSVIARRYGTTPAQILMDNNKRNERIVVGERLTIRTGAQASQVATTSAAPAVSRSESTTVSAAPPTPAKAQSARVIQTPPQATVATTTVKDTASVPVVHTVARGDTLYSIARRYQVSIEHLRRLNELSNDRITIGQKIKITSNNEKIETATQIDRTQTSAATSANSPTTPAAAVVGSTNAPKILTHKVAPGETLSSIARSHGTTVEQIKSDNNLTGDFITIGQEIAIHKPANTPSVASGKNPGHKVYVVKAGDTLSSIARAHGVKLEDLIAANNLESPNIRVGQKLIIPGQSTANTAPAPPPPPARGSGTGNQTPAEVYIVEAGDTLFKIALRYGISVDSLSRANALSEGDILRVGQQLLIPARPITEVARN